MGGNVDGTQADNGAADEQEEEDNQESKDVPQEEAACTDLEALPVDVLGRGYFLIFDIDRIDSSGKELSCRFVETAATAISGAVVGAGVKEVVVVEKL